MATAQATKPKQSQAISLKGSVKIVTDFFEYSVVRPPSLPVSRPLLLTRNALTERFRTTSSTSAGYTRPRTSRWSKSEARRPSPSARASLTLSLCSSRYGQPMLVTTDEGLKDYISAINEQVGGVFPPGRLPPCCISSSIPSPVG